MRLSVLDHGHRRRARLFLALTSAMSRVDSPDIVKMLLYRPGFLTRPLLELTADAMRGPSYWTAGEREYLAMCTAQLHRCPFCVDSHAELTRIAGHGEIDPDDPASARPAAARRPRVPRRDQPHAGPRDAGDATPGSPACPSTRCGKRCTSAWCGTSSTGWPTRSVSPSGRASCTAAPARCTGSATASPASCSPTAPANGHGDVVADLRHAVLDAPATTDPALRAAAATGDPLPEPWQAYATTVRDASYRITDTDIDRLIAAGHTEDQIFEVTVAAAVGAALRSFDAGRNALGQKTTG